MVTRLTWDELALRGGQLEDGAAVEMEGWAQPVGLDADERYFLLVASEACCLGAVLNAPESAIEIFLRAGEVSPAGTISVRGRWQRLEDDPNGWKFQLLDATVVNADEEVHHDAAFRAPRRGFLQGALLGLAAFAGPFARAAEDDPGSTDLGRAVDLHSHAGRVIITRSGAEREFIPLREPMQNGGMAIVCLAVVSDSAVTRIANQRIVAYRAPESGELYAWSVRTFARLHELARAQGLSIVTDLDSYRAANAKTRPSIIVTSEGADFLEGKMEHLDEAYSTHQLRQLQLTHYRPNELGDIQTEAPVAGGLTDFGADVVRRCNALGIVVDVAHGTYDLVKRAAAVTTKPLVLSHTSLMAMPAPRSRRITGDHARVIASTGGVIGVWPPATEFPNLLSYSAGIARMVEVVGVEHVGLGSDMLGLLSPASFGDYSQLPELSSALRTTGFSGDDVRKILGANYQRVFEATV